jgi:hypothetical protein
MVQQMLTRHCFTVRESNIICKYLRSIYKNSFFVSLRVARRRTTTMVLSLIGVARQGFKCSYKYPLRYQFFLRQHCTPRSWGWHPGPNPSKHDFPNFTHICKIFSQTGMCKISYKFVKNESYQICINICKLNLALF